MARPNRDALAETFAEPSTSRRHDTLPGSQAPELGHATRPVISLSGIVACWKLAIALVDVRHGLRGFAMGVLPVLPSLPLYTYSLLGGMYCLSRWHLR